MRSSPRAGGEESRAGGAVPPGALREGLRRVREAGSGRRDGSQSGEGAGDGGSAGSGPALGTASGDLGEGEAAPRLASAGPRELQRPQSTAECAEPPGRVQSPWPRAEPSGHAQRPWPCAEPPGCVQSPWPREEPPGCVLRPTQSSCWRTAWGIQILPDGPGCTSRAEQLRPLPPEHSQVWAPTWLYPWRPTLTPISPRALPAAPPSRCLSLFVRCLPLCVLLQRPGLCSPLASVALCPGQVSPRSHPQRPAADCQLVPQDHPRPRHRQQGVLLGLAPAPSRESLPRSGPRVPTDSCRGLRRLLHFPKARGPHAGAHHGPDGLLASGHTRPGPVCTQQPSLPVAARVSPGKDRTSGPWTRPCLTLAFPRLPRGGLRPPSLPRGCPAPPSPGPDTGPGPPSSVCVGYQPPAAPGRARLTQTGTPSAPNK
ncbi:basic proline-rich protein-like [Lepus europaeus]|uniref:basic proline-rich protein-like n=1 Tax=Lepus europaeus TaxID=9983 RepID=UPI002B482430|nr:basic proline-rich protein-like [Lepus europaeus]